MKIPRNEISFLLSIWVVITVFQISKAAYLIKQELLPKETEYYQKAPSCLTVIDICKAHTLLPANVTIHPPTVLFNPESIKESSKKAAIKEEERYLYPLSPKEVKWRSREEARLRCKLLIKIAEKQNISDVGGALIGLFNRKDIVQWLSESMSISCDQTLNQSTMDNKEEFLMQYEFINSNEEKVQN